jgi:UDPglucose 6-dehydrogenase
VYGTAHEDARSGLRRVYAPLGETYGTPVDETDVATAELIKHASNAFLATKISFINTVAAICEQVGADVDTVAEGMGHDVRIGPHFLQAGLGYGGSCFPKDVDAFLHLAEQLGVDFTILAGAHRTNLLQRERVLDKLRSELWHLTDKTITLLGAAFKPGTDDIRESPAGPVIRALQREGAVIKAYDPVARHEAEKLFGNESISYCESLPHALQEIDAVVLMTRWAEFSALPDLLAELEPQPVLIDGRRMLNKDLIAHYEGIGL